MGIGRKPLKEVPMWIKINEFWIERICQQVSCEIENATENMAQITQEESVSRNQSLSDNPWLFQGTLKARSIAELEHNSSRNNVSLKFYSTPKRYKQIRRFEKGLLLTLLLINHTTQYNYQGILDSLRRQWIVRVRDSYYRIFALSNVYLCLFQWGRKVNNRGAHIHVFVFTDLDLTTTDFWKKISNAQNEYMNMRSPAPNHGSSAATGLFHARL